MLPIVLKTFPATWEDSVKIRFMRHVTDALAESDFFDGRSA